MKPFNDPCMNIPVRREVSPLPRLHVSPRQLFRHFPGTLQHHSRRRPGTHPALHLFALGSLLGVLLLSSVTTRSWAQKRPPSDLTESSLEDLMKMEVSVTSVSRTKQKLSKVAAAIFVITREDIRRSGATNIPDLLRRVPGLEVAQTNANTWAVTSRGLNSRQDNKMLVLIDGRNVYRPWTRVFYWDMEDVPLVDIDRIEVIRGPGATVWGANAVNGVISIFTKRAQATQGGLVEGGNGNETGFGLVQYGGKLRHHGHYRAFARYFNYDNLVDASSRRTADGWHALHGGFRSDWELTKKDSVTLQGDIYNTEAGQTLSSVVSLSPPFSRVLNDPISTVGGNLLGRWNHSFSGRSDIGLQLYFDRDQRFEANGLRKLDTFNLDFYHHVAAGSRHDFVWGLSYRLTKDEAHPTYTQSFDPVKRADNLYSSFIQDEIRLADRISLTLATKIEHNPYTGYEVQPSARVVWALRDTQAIWAAVSRPTRQPSRNEEDVRSNGPASVGPGGLITLTSRFGNRKFKSESLVAYELGYRLEQSKRLSWDFATFYNVYRNLRTVEPASAFFENDPPPRHLVRPSVYGNQMHGHGYGAEVAANWRLSDRWKLSPSYTWLKLNLHRDPASQDLSSEATAGSTPRHQFQIQSQVNLLRNVEFDSALYSVGSLTRPTVPNYTRVDARLAWRPSESIELDLVGQNLTEPHHLEFHSNSRLDSEVRRSVYGKITWHF